MPPTTEAAAAYASIEIAKDHAIIRLPLEPEGTLTKKGDNRLIVSTHGTVTIQASDKKQYKLNVNVTSNK